MFDIRVTGICGSMTHPSHPGHTGLVGEEEKESRVIRRLHTLPLRISTHHSHSHFGGKASHVTRADITLVGRILFPQGPFC